MWKCPLCHQPLSLLTNQLGCQTGHRFDIAKEGYSNLLPVQHKNSKNPGDNPQMIAARRAFLEQGHYGPLALAIVELLRPLAQATKLKLLDIGCGEGYYSANLCHDLGLEGYGIDISKAAIKAAAKRYPTQHWAVASAYQLPVLDQSMDILLRVYAPSLPAEMARVCKKQGWLLTVTPAPMHLYEFKQRIYAEPRLHSDIIAIEAGFVHRQRQRLQWQWTPPQADALLALLDMVPLAYKFDETMRQQLAVQLPTISLDFYLDMYQRHDES